MEKYVIKGGSALHGEVEISGAKNAAVAIIPAALMVDGVCRIENLPQISDTDMLLTILADLGAKVSFINKSTIEIDCTDVHYSDAPYDLMRKIRASYYLIGAMLGRFGTAKTTMPGGCNFGVRPIDQHIKAFEALGAEVTVDGGFIDAQTKNGITGAGIYFDCVTVGGTINTILAAVRAKGTTVIENAAREPHVVDVANFLNYCGANITGAGTDTIKIKGTDDLRGCTYAIIPDMIEAGTFMIAAAATRGRLYINNVIPKHLDAISAKLVEMGVTVEEFDDAVLVSHKGELSPVTIKTIPYPGFPTDMNPQAAVLLCLANGTSRLHETIYENRFRYVEELKRMGANIKVEKSIATITGIDHLTASTVRAVDLRAGVAMVIAGLAARGRTEIDDIYHIERGYDNITSKFKAVGANIHKVVIPDPFVTI